MSGNDNMAGRKRLHHDPGCFEEWLFERRHRQDEVGRVARWVLDRMKPDHPARWTPEPVLLARHGHAYDVPAHYERVLRHVANQPEESIQTFFRAYDLYLKDARADYDRMVEERSRKLGAESGGGENDNAASTTTTSAEVADDEPEERHSLPSWTRFYHDLLGPEQTGYGVDEDGDPIVDEPRDEGRE